MGAYDDVFPTAPASRQSQHLDSVRRILYEGVIEHKDRTRVDGFESRVNKLIIESTNLHREARLEAELHDKQIGELIELRSNSWRAWTAKANATASVAAHEERNAYAAKRKKMK